MAQSYRAARFLLLLGLVSGLIAVAAVPSIDSGPPEHVSLSLTIIFSVGLLLLGLVGRYDDNLETERVATLPATILSVVGICTAVVGVIAFEPWVADLMQGFRTAVAGGWVLFGSGLVLAGMWWRRQAVTRYPLAVLTTGLLLSLFYLLYELLNTALPPITPQVILLFVVVAGAPGLWLLFRHQPEMDAQ